MAALGVVGKAAWRMAVVVWRMACWVVWRMACWRTAVVVWRMAARPGGCFSFFARPKGVFVGQLRQENVEIL